MKCPKCGAEVSEKDKFCEECGTALQPKETEPKAVTESDGCSETKSIPDESVDMKGGIEPKNTVNSKKKGIMIGVICVAVVLIVGVVIATFGSSEYNFEAKELAEMIAADTEATYNKYEGDTLHVHGYFYSDGLSDYWALYSDKDADLENAGLEDIVLFSPTDEVTGKLNEIGNGSEITITGTLSSLDQDMTMLVVDAQTVEILNAEERTYIVDNVSDIINDSKDYLDKKVRFVAAVDVAGYSDVIACDIGNEYNNEYLSLTGISDAEIEQIQHGAYTVIGRVCKEKNKVVINVEKIEFLENLDNQETEYEYEFDSVKSLYDTNLRSYTGSKISVYGKIVIGSGMYPTIMLYDPVSGMNIDLYVEDDNELWYHDSEAVTVYGTLDGGVGDPYFIRVEDFKI